MRKPRIDATGAFLLVICSGLMGLNQVLIKTVNGGLQPVFQAGLRSVCAFILVLVFACLMKKKLSITDGSFWPGVLAGLFFSGEFLLLFLALDYTTVSRASIFFYTMPFWVAIGGHFLIPAERLTLIQSAGLVLAFSGVIVALVVNPDKSSSVFLTGDLMCILASILWAAIVLLTRATSFSRSSPEMQLLYQLAVSAVVLLPVSLLFGELVRDFTLTIGLLFAFQVIAIACFGFLTWFWLLSVYPASNMASFSFLSPVLGVFFGWMILDEYINIFVVAALILVSSGVYLVNVKNISSRGT